MKNKGLKITGLLSAVIFSNFMFGQKTNLEWFVFNTLNSGLKSNKVISVAIDKNGSTWFGGSAADGALVEFDGKDWIPYHTSNSPLPDNKIASIYVDGTGMKWVGTDYGIAKMKHDNWNVYHTTNSKIPANRVKDMASDHQGNGWMATIAGLVKLEGSNWITYNTRNSDLPDNNVNTVAVDAENNVWAGTQKGLVKITLGGSMISGSSWQVFTTKNSGLPSNIISDITIDYKNNIWIGTYDKGIAKFDNSVWTKFDKKNSGLSHNSITSLAADIDGVLWAGTQEGLNKYNGTEWIKYTTTNSSLADNYINSIAVDMSGNKWIGTNNGLTMYKENGLQFSTYVAKYLFKRTDVAQDEDNLMRGGGDPLKGLNVADAKKIQSTGKYYAVIIGVDDYKGVWKPLNNAVNDAKAVEKLLKDKYRFDEFKTLYNEDATRKNIIGEFEKLVEKVQKNDNVFIYYSGHGEYKQNLNKGYWVPSDAQNASTAEYISNSDLKTYIGGMDTKHTLLVSDACFSGEIFRGSTHQIAFDDPSGYFEKAYALNSRQAITSGGIEPVMDGGKNGHSVFAYYFLKNLGDNKDKYFTANQLYKNIKVPVVNNSVQTPQIAPITNTGDEGGEFVFISK